MNSTEAKEILLRYRPGTSDASDPEVRAAVEQAARDPELAGWLQDHHVFQQAVMDRLRRVAPPEGLREQILSEQPRLFTLRHSARRLAWSALAAAILVAGFVYLAMNRVDEESRFATFRMRMVKTALRGYAMDIETNDTVEIRKYLETQQAPSDWQSPRGLEAIPVMGGAVLQWRSQPATLICYGAGPQPDLWLFVVDSSALPDPPAPETPVVKAVIRLNTVSWNRHGRTYVLAGERSADELLRLVKDRS